MIKKKSRKDPAQIVITIVVGLITLLCLLPIINTIAISFSDKTSAATGKVYLLPKNVSLIAYEEILKDNRFVLSFIVSLKRLVLGTLLGTLISIMMAYPLSKNKSIFPMRNVYVWFMVFTMLFSGGMIPSYLVIKKLGLLDTLWVLVLPGSVSVYNTIILMNFYKGLPDALAESAMIDGARPYTILIKIFVPLAKPSIATIALFTAVGHWNAFFDGKIYINTPTKVPLQTYIQTLSADVPNEMLANMDPEEAARMLQMSSITFNAAKAIVAMIPIVAVYPFIQKFFVTGIVMGSVKE